MAETATADLDALLEESGFSDERIVHLPDASVAELLREHYGLDVELRRLPTEKDDTFRAVTDDGAWTVKISSPAEPVELIGLQTEAMIWAGDHMSSHGPAVPRVLRSRTGAASVPLSADDAGGLGARRVLRVLEYLPGVPLGMREGYRPTASELAGFGGACAHLSLAMRGFSQSSDARRLAWDLAELPTLAPLAEHLSGRELELAERSLSEYEKYAAAVVPTLDHQVGHNDFNPFNVLLGDDGHVAGVIDFGDVVRTATVLDAAVGAGSMIDLDERGWWLVTQFMAGYLQVRDLDWRELEVLAVAAPARQAQRLLLRGLAAAQSAERAAYLASHATDLADPLAGVLNIEVAERVASLRELRRPS
ncbi:phosphotransferase [Pseudoclavibacter soli]|uniref:phosphotransferase n=1 Tax=Pseudoclavibacter soli TaxID=452623 RepID=UPI0003F974B8|nr:phosphotransferase [Pseudoclavibacter soli]